jgi:DNA-binding response OmpR family regulator
MNAGAVEYLNKPVKTEELIAIIRKCLRSRATR